MFWEGRPVESGNDIRRLDLARTCAQRRRVFSWDKERTHGEPPHARRALEGARDRPPGGHPRLRRRRRAHLPGQDRQDPLRGAARGARCAPEALDKTDYADLRAAAARGFREPPFVAALFVPSPAAGFGFCAAATLALSASIRSTTGVSTSGSAGFAISWPLSFASSIARRSRRYSLSRSPGSKSP